ncbi:MAG: YeeE/YedE family protein [Calditrichaeota bacterium]|nr:YeeE/YedE family protein [Calditrichota bacterium]
MFLTILILGFLFGLILQRARLNTFDTIGGFAMLEDLTVAKALLVAVGVGAILLSLEIWLGWASFHVKPLIVGGVVAGGLIFGAGMAILGYCPGTLAVSLGEGAIDAFVGILGGLFGGLVFTWLFPGMKSILGPNLGKLSIGSLLGGHPAVNFVAALVVGGVFIWFAFYLDGIEKKRIKN